jgi:hypothetical protein
MAKNTSTKELEDLQAQLADLDAVKAELQEEQAQLIGIASTVQVRGSPAVIRERNRRRLDAQAAADKIGDELAALDEQRAVMQAQIKSIQGQAQTEQQEAYRKERLILERAAWKQAKPFIAALGELADLVGANQNQSMPAGTIILNSHLVKHLLRLADEAKKRGW